MNEKEREQAIEQINLLPENIRRVAYTAYLLGHEDGWWLNRTDPDVSHNPLDHAYTTNPFDVS
jgi:hypothetical protein